MKAAALGCSSRLLGAAAAVSHSECVTRAERLWEAARTGLGRSPPAGVCRLTDSSALVYHTAAAAAAMRRECWSGKSTPSLSTECQLVYDPIYRKIIIIATEWTGRVSPSFYAADCIHTAINEWMKNNMDVHQDTLAVRYKLQLV